MWPQTGIFSISRPHIRQTHWIPGKSFVAQPYVSHKLFRWIWYTLRFQNQNSIGWYCGLGLSSPTQICELEHWVPTWYLCMPKLWDLWNLRPSFRRWSLGMNLWSLCLCPNFSFLILSDVRNLRHMLSWTLMCFRHDELRPGSKVNLSFLNLLWSESCHGSGKRQVCKLIITEVSLKGLLGSFYIYKILPPQIFELNCPGWAPVVFKAL